MLPSPPAYSESRGSSKVIMRGGLSGVSRFALGSYLVFLCSSSCGILSQRGQELPPSLLLSKNARVATTPFLTGGQAGRLRIYVCIYLGSQKTRRRGLIMMWLSKQVTAKRTIPYLTPLLCYRPGRTNGPLLIKWPDVAPPFPIPYHLKQESRQPTPASQPLLLLKPPFRFIRWYVRLAPLR